MAVIANPNPSKRSTCHSIDGVAMESGCNVWITSLPRGFKARLSERSTGRRSSAWLVCRSPNGSQGLPAPVKLKLDEDGAPSRHALPRDGANYSRDIEELFPKHVISRLSGNEHVDRVSRLWSRPESSAK